MEKPRQQGDRADEVGVQLGEAYSAESSGAGLVAQRSIGQQEGIEVRHPRQNFVHQGGMHFDCGEVGGDIVHAGGATRCQIAGDGGQALGMAGDQQKFLVIGRSQAGNLLRDLRGRSEDYDFAGWAFCGSVCVAHRASSLVMRRQNPDEDAGPQMAGSAPGRGRRASNMWRLMRPSLAG